MYACENVGVCMYVCVSVCKPESVYLEREYIFVLKYVNMFVQDVRFVYTYVVQWAWCGRNAVV